MTNHQNRQKRQAGGVPAGGQYTFAQRHEAQINLPGPTASNESGAVPASGMPVLGTAAAGYRDWVDGDGHLVKQVRFNGAKPDDAPDGTAAVILYSEASTLEKHYREGDLHDGSGHTPSTLFAGVNGKVVTTRGYRQRAWGMTPQDTPDGQPAEVIVEPDGTMKTHWKASGIRQDPAPGVPAITVHFADGSVEHVHAPYGAVSDLDDGTPAQRRWNKDGLLILEARYHCGALYDGDDGSAAHRTFRDDGTLEKETRVWGNRTRPGINGEPAVTAYNADGTVASVTQDTRSQHSIWPDDEPRSARPTWTSGGRKEPHPRDLNRSQAGLVPHT